jgi:hypothetical protein
VEWRRTRSGWCRVSIAMEGDAGISDRMKQLEEWDVPLHLRVGAKRSEPSQRHRGESTVARGGRRKREYKCLGDE